MEVSSANILLHPTYGGGRGQSKTELVLECPLRLIAQQSIPWKTSRPELLLGNDAELFVTVSLQIVTGQDHQDIYTFHRVHAPDFMLKHPLCKYINIYIFNTTEQVLQIVRSRKHVSALLTPSSSSFICLPTILLSIGMMQRANRKTTIRFISARIPAFANTAPTVLRISSSQSHHQFS